MSTVTLDYVRIFIECKMNEIDAIFKDAEEESGSEGCSLCDQLRRESRSWSPTGRLGPSLVVFDINTNVGSLVMDCDRLTVTSQSGFSSIKATTGVYKGKWQFEVMLGSKGVMQIGWATQNCKFSHEKGVGDSIDSYSFDGSRVRKWNLTTYPYGEAWFPGDVIGCTIDLEDGTIDFYRNGHHLGLAFDSVRFGPGFCYFPSVSLAYNESLTANFGGCPFKYPVSGYQPLQETPLIEVAKGDVLINWMFNLLEESNLNQITSANSNSFTSTNATTSITPMNNINSSNNHNSHIHSNSNPSSGGQVMDNGSRKNLAIFLVSHTLLQYLTPLLSNKFVIEGCLLKKLLSLSTSGNCNTRLIHSFLDMLWTFYDKCVMHEVLEILTGSLINCYRFSRVYLKRDQINGTCVNGSRLEHHLDYCTPVYANLTLNRNSFADETTVSKGSDEVQRECSSSSQNQFDPSFSTPASSASARPYLANSGTTIDAMGCTSTSDNVTAATATTTHSAANVSSYFNSNSQVTNSSSNTSLTYSSGSGGGPPKISFAAQKKCLMVFLNLIQHSKTRCHLLRHILFEKAKFPFLLDIKPVNEASWLEKEIFPSINLQSFVHFFNVNSGNVNSKDDDSSSLNNNQPGSNRSSTPCNSTSTQFWSSDIECAINELEELHQVILDTLIFQDEICRLIFITKFDAFLKENCILTPASRLAPSLETVLTQSPLPAVSSFFHRLTSLIRVQYESMVDVIPRAFFLYASCVSHETTRLGGLMSHLSKVHEREIAKYTLENHSMNPLLRHVYILIHGLIKLYTTSAHKYISKHCILRERLIEVSTSLATLSTDEIEMDAETVKSRQVTRQVLQAELLAKSRQLGWLNSTALTSSKRADVCWLLKLLLNTLDSASSNDCIFSFVPDYYIESCLNLCQALRDFFGYSPSHCYSTSASNSTFASGSSSAATASSSSSSSFTFATGIAGCSSSFFSPSLTNAERKEYQDTIDHFARFLCKHFLDDRIVNSDIKDLLTQSLAKFISYPDTLKSAECIPLENRMSMVTALTSQFYESRSWAQTNWIIARFWKGDGFAYRYNNLNYTRANALSVTAATSGKDVLSLLNNLKPCPSKVFQGHIRDFLTANPATAYSFLSSLLAQLNWSFSEFIGMLQEIQNAANKPEKVFIDPRQLKVCCTCFDLTVTLLRVLEMIAHLNPLLITSASSSDPSSDLLLSQLCSILNQILSRITTKTGSFEFVTNLDLPGFESISHFAILGAVCGILIELLLRGPPSSQASAALALVTDANFLPSNFAFITYDSSGEANCTSSLFSSSSPSSSSSSASVCTSLLRASFNEIVKSSDANMHHLTSSNACAIMHSPELNSIECTQLKQLAAVITSQTLTLDCNSPGEFISDDEVCTICYANRKTAIFVPCGHQSCR